MPTIEDVVQVVVAAAGGAGLGQLVRAWGQNRNERDVTLTSEQREFRQSQRDAIGDLEKRNEYLTGRLDAIDIRNVELVQDNAKLKAKLEIQDLQIEHMADQLTATFADRDKLKRTVAGLEEKGRHQEIEIAELRSKVGHQEAEILALHQQLAVWTQQYGAPARDSRLRTRETDQESAV